MADEPPDRDRGARRRAARLRGRHRQAAGQAARGARPPERDRDPPGERRQPRRGCARCTPARRSTRPSRASTCSSARPIWPRAMPRRSASAAAQDARGGDRRAAQRREGRRRARGDEGGRGGMTFQHGRRRGVMTWIDFTVDAIVAMLVACWSSTSDRAAKTAADAGHRGRRLLDAARSPPPDDRMEHARRCSSGRMAALGAPDGWNGF